MKMNPFEAFGRTGTTGLVLGIWAAAIICVIGAISAASSAVDVQTQAQALQQLVPRGITVKEQVLSKGEYEAITDALAPRYTAISISTGRKYVEIETKDLNGYFFWLSAIFDVLSSQPDVRWSVSYLCAGEGCTGTAYKAQLEGTRRVAITQ